MADVLENQRYYDTFAAGYERRRHHGYHKLIDDLESSLVLPSAAGTRVLEVGCGTGLILERVAAVARQSVGVDLSPRMLEHARAKGLEVLRASATALPFAAATFDVTYSFKVLAHVQHLERALVEMARVTRPGGRLFLEFYNRRSLRYVVRRLRGGARVAPGVHDNQVFVRFDTEAQLRRQLPPQLELRAVHGVRVFTLIPGVHRLPLVGAALGALERRAMSSSLGRFGGFLVLECVRRS